VDLGYLATDKTGTLTKGVFAVSAIHPVDISKEELLEYATAVESRSNHPLASALLHGVDAGAYASKVSEYSEVAGKGVKGVYQGHTVLCGNDSFLEEEGIEVLEAKEVGSHLHVAVDHKYAGYLVLADELRKETKQMVERLRQDGVAIALLSGDKEANVQAVAKDLNLDVYQAELLPEEKTKRLEAILASKEKKTVAYMGDGINDAASIRMADVGIAMGGIGSDLAIENADVVIMKDDPSKVADARNIAKLVRGYAIFDIVFALLIKLTILILAVTVPNYPMIVSSLADTGLTLLLVGITMSLLHRKVR
jgi:Cd2+/Zn2+-exporting ATPase